MKSHQADSRRSNAQRTAWAKCVAWNAKSREGEQTWESSPAAEGGKRRLKCPEDLNGLCERSGRKTAEGDKVLSWQ